MRNPIIVFLLPMRSPSLPNTAPPTGLNTNVIVYMLQVPTIARPYFAGKKMPASTGTKRNSMLRSNASIIQPTRAPG